MSAIRDICDVEYIDNNILKLSTEDLAADIIFRRPDIVGFGGTLTEWTQAKNVAAILPSSIITIYGGPNATANPEKHVKYFDYVLRGWAEESLKYFILGLSHGFAPDPIEDKIEGCCWDGYIVPAALSCDFNKLNYPARNIIDINWYQRKQFDVASPVDIVVASRGCPFDCRFCFSKSIWNREYKKREVEAVIEEIEYMQEFYGTKTIHFREDNLTVDHKYLDQLCGELRKLKVDWICQSRIDVLNKEIVQIMKASGCKVICCGFESANDSTLESIHKGFTFKQVCDTIQIFEEVGINYSGGFIVGLPNEGEEEIKNTLEFAKKVNQLPHSFVPRGAGRFVCWPKSEVYQEVIDNNLIAYNWQNGEMLIPNTYKLSAQQVEDCIKRYW